MKLLKKAKLSLALTAAIGAVALSGQATAVNLSTDGIGDVAIAPYYSVNDGWLTLINLTNTSNKPLVVKVRVHEGKNSRDVYDFDVALSGRDVYSAVLKRNAAGAPVISSTDTDTCTIPQNIANAPLSALGYSGNDDNGNNNDDALQTAGSVAHTVRLGEGYIEFIVMGYTNVDGADVDAAFAFNNSPGSASATVGYNIENHNCAEVESAFTTARMTTASANGPSTQSQFGEPLNALKFNFRLLNPSRGIEVGNAATTWANFFNSATNAGGLISADPANLIGTLQGTPLGNDTCTIGRGNERNGAVDWDPSDDFTAATVLSCDNLMTSQEPYDFLEPSLNDAYPAVPNVWDDATNAPAAFSGALVGVTDATRLSPIATSEPAATGGRGVDAISATIQRTAVINEWSLNSALGSKTDWVITMPTKSFYVDAGPARQFARVKGDRDEAYVTGDLNYVPAAQTPGQVGYVAPIAYPPFANVFGVNGSCNQVSFDAFDRAENQEVGTSGVIASPAPASATTDLCWEANVLTFNGAPSLLGSNNVTDVPLTKLVGNGAQAGWLRLDLTTESSAQAATAADANGLVGGLLGSDGLPVIGMMVKQRTFGDVTKNYGSSLDHGYERN